MVYRVFCEKQMTGFLEIPTGFLSYFLKLPDAPSQSYVFPVPALEAAFSSRAPTSCHWTTVFRKQDWVVGVFITTGVFQTLSVDKDRTYMYVYASYLYRFLILSFGSNFMQVMKN